MTVTVDIVVPTVGRKSLTALLESLAAQTVTPGRIVLVDDRRCPERPLPIPPAAATLRLDVVRTGGRGPAAARNAGWRTSDANWVAFLDDDVLPPADWFGALLADLALDGRQLAASQFPCRPGVARPTGNATSPAWSGRNGRQPTWPTAAQRWPRSAGSTNASPGPTGKTPIWGFGSCGPVAVSREAGGR
jgi:glycosyltransferase involved in cell wall biosynthesis